MSYKQVDVLLFSNITNPGVVGAKPHVGLEFIKEHLLANGVSCDINYDCNISNTNPLVIGISGYPNEVLVIKLLSASIKSRLPYTRVVIGGPVSIFHNELLKAQCIDAVCFGEGESSLLEYVNRLKSGESLNNIPGFYQRGSKFIKSQPLNLNDLITPSYHCVDLSGNAYLSTSRGCNGSCSFCEAKLFNQGLRVMSADKVINWVDKLIANHDLKEISLLDDNFLAVPQRAEKILDYLSKLGLKVDLISRADSLVKSESLILDYADIIRMISVGIESFSQSQLDRWHKCLSVETNVSALELLHKARVYSDSFIIISDGKTTLNESIEQVNGIKSAPPTVYNGFDIPFSLRNYYLATVSHTRFNKNKYCYFEIKNKPFLNKPYNFLESTLTAMNFLSESVIQSAFDKPQVINEILFIAEKRLDIYLAGMNSIIKGEVKPFNVISKDFTKSLNSITKKISNKNANLKKFYNSLKSKLV